jgi:hypothetical protein
MRKPRKTGQQAGVKVMARKAIKLGKKRKK